jgi:hypothetical protein
VSDPQLVWQIQGSTNLQDWEILGLITNTPGVFQFLDPAANSMPWRFYQAIPWP